ncbi:MAG: NotI family restriction endonuclease [Candidatus Binatia bacterium]
MSKTLELFGLLTTRDADWRFVVDKQQCPYLERKCLKIRKSEPTVSIGSCTVRYGQHEQPIIICPYRLLERKQVFTDCLHLLTLHEPGNEFHVIPELSIPGGSIDYCLASVKGGKVKDFVGIELQTLDTTGTVWPERQRFLRDHHIPVLPEDVSSTKSFGMNWKMTSKTILVQLHHKIETFEHINKHLVLAVQDRLIAYMRTEFSFGHLNTPARLGDPMHIHAYTVAESEAGLRLELSERTSTDTAGIAACLGLQVSPHMDLEVIVKLLESKLSPKTLLTFEGPMPSPEELPEA